MSPKHTQGIPEHTEDMEVLIFKNQKYPETHKTHWDFKLKILLSPKHTQILNANVSKTHWSFECNLCQEHTESLTYVKTHWDFKLMSQHTDFINTNVFKTHWV